MSEMRPQHIHTFNNKNLGFIQVGIAKGAQINTHEFWFS